MAVGDGKKVLEGARVLITGADGFMGSHLTEKLLEFGAEVSIYARGSSDCGTSKFEFKNIGHVKNRFKHILTGNIAEKDAVKLIKQNEPEYIFHLAADAYVPNSFDHPFEVMQTNLVGTINVLHAAMELKGLKPVVCT